MTMENVLTFAVILVLLIVALREWLDILSRYPIFIAAVIVFLAANAFGADFAGAMAGIFKIAAAIVVTIVIGAFIIALDEVKEERKNEGKRK